MKQIYFINGMPRSGSTLLCNVLAQNPDFHATATSGLSELIRGISQAWKNNPIIKASENTEKLLQIVRDMFQSYHSDTTRSVVFNKSRGWVSMIELVENALQKEIKILTTTRKMPNILASLEKLYRKELKIINSPMEQKTEMETLEGRLMTWTSPSGLVGYSFNSIRDAVMRGYRNRIHLVDFDDFTCNPEMVTKNIYNFLDKKYYKHNFQNIEQYTKENDAEHGFSDLHTIRKKIEPVFDDSQFILGQSWHDYCNFHYNF